MGRKLRSAMLCLLMCSLSIREDSAQSNEDANEKMRSLILRERYAYNIKMLQEISIWDIDTELPSNIAERKHLRGRRSAMAVVVNHGSGLQSGRCKRRTKGELYVECELSDVVPSTVNLVGRMPLITSDYHSPRTHPPKNN